VTPWDPAHSPGVAAEGRGRCQAYKPPPGLPASAARDRGRAYPEAGSGDQRFAWRWDEDRLRPSWMRSKLPYRHQSEWLKRPPSPGINREAKPKKEPFFKLFRLSQKSPPDKTKRPQNYPHSGAPRTTSNTIFERGRPGVMREAGRASGSARMGSRILQLQGAGAGDLASESSRSSHRRSHGIWPGNRASAVSLSAVLPRTATQKRKSSCKSTGARSRVLEAPSDCRPDGLLERTVVADCRQLCSGLRRFEACA